METGSRVTKATVGVKEAPASPSVVATVAVLSRMRAPAERVLRSSKGVAPGQLLESRKQVSAARGLPNSRREPARG